MDEKEQELRLLRKNHSGIQQLFFGRMTIVLVLLLLNIGIVFLFALRFEQYLMHYVSSNAIIGVGMVLYLLNQKMSSAMRTAWVIIVMTDPIFGSILYFFLELDLGHQLLRRRVQAEKEKSESLLTQTQPLIGELSRHSPGAASLCRYLNRNGAIAYGNTTVEYLPLGEAKLQRLLEELEKAEKYIYLEYFIISEGTMWGRVLDVLARKAAQGVDVRVMYDGTCEFILLPRSYPKKLEKLSIRCKVFSPISVFVSTHYNYRDHRKIAVIDGHTAFNGGINLSDEYMNIDSPCGHWKDTALVLKGDGVQGFTRLFLQMWNLDEKHGDYSALLTPPAPAQGRGVVVPFGDEPLDHCMTGQNAYMNMIGRAVSTVDIVTPYLMIDSEMENTLCHAAQRGVRVRLLLPGVPDKYIPYALAKTHYKALVEAGVELYEYTPGFTHAKMVITDGCEAVVGTINFDYRSFCHHFECGTWILGCDCIADISNDYDSCIALSRRVTADSIRHEKWHRKVIGFVLKVFEPLL